MHNVVYELRRIPLLRTRVNKGASDLPAPLQAFVPEAFRWTWSYPELVALSFFAEDVTIHEALCAVP
jgi:hypothetical protein